MSDYCLLVSVLSISCVERGGIILGVEHTLFHTLQFLKIRGIYILDLLEIISSKMIDIKTNRKLKIIFPTS